LAALRRLDTSIDPETIMSREPSTGVVSGENITSPGPSSTISKFVKHSTIAL
jgi:hypothetical protein